MNEHSQSKKEFLATIVALQRDKARDVLSSIDFSSKAKKSSLIQEAGNDTMFHYLKKILEQTEIVKRVQVPWFILEPEKPLWKKEMREGFLSRYEISDDVIAEIRKHQDAESKEAKQAPHDQDGTSVIKAVASLIVLGVVYVITKFGRK